MQKLDEYLGFLYGILCFVSALLQYNDPDPMLWIVIYSCATILSIAFALNKIHPILLALTAAISFFGFFYMYPEKFEGFEIGAGDIKNIEEAREAFGLLIMAIMFIIFSFRAKKKLG
ncbi:transmembrane family 220 protein [Maribacter vaceletii]|uniref:Transmembrane family 220 protein n=1 Tax=Maribacter vaceletii TaxID=1206816 RepID=A0A495DUF3_9FLAO|nr:transmembrane 220 family protein [Maribacter vaceletii]RKR08088.1 transmembrane family 220 protein [Maribacter vaceletii]